MPFTIPCILRLRSYEPKVGKNKTHDEFNYLHARFTVEVEN